MRAITPLNELLQIRIPLIMAPMFLVSNQTMMESAIDGGIMGVFPSLNYRGKGELERQLSHLNNYKQGKSGNFGINLIVQKTNPLYRDHLNICIAQKVPFYITSLGSPAEVIHAGHAYGAKVFCDVTNLVHAEKCAGLGCDGFIAVGQGAGGHAGPNPLSVLVPALREKYPHLPVIGAGGVATGAGFISMLALGASGVSVGTRFIASKEASVSDEYKQAVLDSGMDDITLTERLSGTPCTIIDTPFAKKIGYRQNSFERMLSKNSNTKKFFKMLVQVRGMKQLEAAVKPGNYNNLWCAGKSVALVHEILSCAQIISNFENEMEKCMKSLNEQIKF